MLLPKQERFVDAYIQTGNLADAVYKAGYKARNRNSASSIGYENLQKVEIKQAIEKRRASIREVIQDETEHLLRELLQLVYSPETPPGIRVRIAQDLLDRAGYSAQKDVSLTVEQPIVVETRHTLEIARRAREILAEKHEKNQASLA